MTPKINLCSAIGLFLYLLDKESGVTSEVTWLRGIRTISCTIPGPWHRVDSPQLLAAWWDRVHQVACGNYRGLPAHPNASPLLLRSSRVPADDQRCPGLRITSFLVFRGRAPEPALALHRPLSEYNFREAPSCPKISSPPMGRKGGVDEGASTQPITSPALCPCTFRSQGTPWTLKIGCDAQKVLVE